SGLTFSVAVQDSAGAAGLNNSVNLDVLDAALTAGTLTPPPAAAEGQAISNAVLFHFTDADPGASAADFPATVTWGGGTVEDSVNNPGTVQVVANPSGGFDVVGSHTYAEEASGLTFGVSVADHGATPAAAATGSFSVADAALTAGSLTPPVGAVA